VRTNPFTDELLADLPSEHVWVAQFVVRNRLDHVRSGHFGLGPTDETWLNRASCIESRSVKLSKVPKRKKAV